MSLCDHLAGESWLSAAAQHQKPAQHVHLQSLHRSTPYAKLWVDVPLIKSKTSVSQRLPMLKINFPHHVRNSNPCSACWKSESSFFSVGARVEGKGSWVQLGSCDMESVFSLWLIDGCLVHHDNVGLDRRRFQDSQHWPSCGRLGIRTYLLHLPHIFVLTDAVWFLVAHSAGAHSKVLGVCLRLYT